MPWPSTASGIIYFVAMTTLISLFLTVNLSPMWVADMGFATPPEIISAIKDRLDDRIFGYTRIFDPRYFVPDENQLQECREYGHKIADAMEAKEAEAVSA